MPSEMVRAGQWICWKWGMRDGKKTKIPIDPNTGNSGKANDPETWSDYHTAKDYADGREDYGIGFVFTEEGPFVGVDLDDCRNPETKEVDDWAERTLNNFKTYTEVSPSGTGYHIITKGYIPGENNRKGDVEVYEDGRFFTVTRDRIPNSPQSVNNCQNALRVLYEHHLADEEPQQRQSSAEPVDIDIEDEEVIEKAKQSESGDEFEELMRGSTSLYGGDHSRADYALCSHLAFWTGGDPQQMDRIFRNSGLMRPKWDESRGNKTYGEMTIENAINSSTDFYEGSSGEP